MDIALENSNALPPIIVHNGFQNDAIEEKPVVV
jgi:hypothetical protein